MKKEFVDVVKKHGFSFIEIPIITNYFKSVKSIYLNAQLLKILQAI